MLAAERGIMENEVWTWLTRIGALAGLAAFAFRAWEFYRDRRPSLRVWFAGSAPGGDTILIFNSSKVATSIYAYSVDALPKGRLNRLWPRFGDQDTSVAQSYEPIHLEVPAHGQVTLTVPEEHGAVHGVAVKDDLYLRLWTSARDRPFTIFLRAGRPIS